jgi:hypothetical protein
MPQVNQAGTGGTFMPDAKKLGLETWFEGRPNAPESGKYKHTKGNDTFYVDFTYRSSSRSLTCNKIEKM